MTYSYIVYNTYHMILYDYIILYNIVYNNVYNIIVYNIVYNINIVYNEKTAAR